MEKTTIKKYSDGCKLYVEKNTLYYKLKTNVFGGICVSNIFKIEGGTATCVDGPFKGLKRDFVGQNASFPIPTEFISDNRSNIPKMEEITFKDGLFCIKVDGKYLYINFTLDIVYQKIDEKTSIIYQGSTDTLIGINDGTVLSYTPGDDLSRYGNDGEFFKVMVALHGDFKMAYMNLKNLQSSNNQDHFRLMFERIQAALVDRVKE